MIFLRKNIPVWQENAGVPEEMNVQRKYYINIKEMFSGGEKFGEVLESVTKNSQQRPCKTLIECYNVINKTIL